MNYNKSKKAWLLLAVLTVGILAFQGTVRAEIFQGKVSFVDAKAGYLSMKYLGSGMEQAQEMKISVPSRAEIKGIHSLNDLRAGDQVKVDASKAFFFFGPWQASTLEATLKPGETAGKEAAGKQPAAAEAPKAENKAQPEQQPSDLSTLE